MSTIKKFSGKITVTGKALSSDYDRDILSYAANAYSFVNSAGQYQISVSEWVDNIKKVFDDNEPRTKEVIRVLLSL